MKAIKISGVTLTILGIGLLVFNLGLWFVTRAQWWWGSKLGPTSWYFYEFPYYHVLGLGTFVVALGATLALLGDRHERSTD
jgi:hypothetical protein